MSNDELRIAAVVTIFNPDDKVIRRIESVLPLVERFFIIDNSESVKEKIKDHFNEHKKVEYIFNGENLGIAAALNIGIKKSIEEGFQFILTLDQDSEFENKSLEILLAAVSSDNNIAIYSSFHKNKFFTNPPPNQDFEEVSDVMTSGNLLNLEAVKKVGYIREDYFIDYVDIEYCLRIREAGYKIIRVNTSFLLHNEANLSRIKIFGFTVYPPNHKPSRWYYKVRNYFYLKKEYQKVFPEYFLLESRNIRNNLIKVLLFERHKLEKIKYAIKGYLAFRKNVKGKLSE